MFTGIIETTGVVKDIVADKSNRIFYVESPISHELKIDQSICHDGVCLTVTEVKGNVHTVVAINETLKRSNLKWKRIDNELNLERAMKLNDRLDGHLVQGHVDAVAQCDKVKPREGSWLFDFSFKEKEFSELMVEKGSICLNGVSLTLVKAGKKKFSVAIIPYTFEHTNFKNLKEGEKVNVEFDVIGKYVQKQLSGRT